MFFLVLSILFVAASKTKSSAAEIVYGKAYTFCLVCLLFGWEFMLNTELDFESDSKKHRYGVVKILVFSEEKLKKRKLSPFFFTCGRGIEISM